ncbi:MAG: hypothetical protein U1E87_03305 [Alphaproteobacteria bacterium]
MATARTRVTPRRSILPAQVRKDLERARHGDIAERRPVALNPSPSRTVRE